MREQTRQPLLPSWAGTWGRAQSLTFASVATTPPRVCDESHACLSHASDAAGVPAIETKLRRRTHPRCRRQNGMIASENGAYHRESAPSIDLSPGAACEHAEALH